MGRITNKNKEKIDERQVEDWMRELSKRKRLDLERDFLQIVASNTWTIGWGSWDPCRVMASRCSLMC